MRNILQKVMTTERKQDCWGEAFANLQTHRAQERQQTSGHELAGRLLKLDAVRMKIGEHIDERKDDTRRDLQKKVAG